MNTYKSITYPDILLAIVLSVFCTQITHGAFKYVQQRSKQPFHQLQKPPIEITALIVKEFFKTDNSKDLIDKLTNTEAFSDLAENLMRAPCLANLLVKQSYQRTQWRKNGIESIWVSLLKIRNMYQKNVRLQNNIRDLFIQLSTTPEFLPIFLSHTDQPFENFNGSVDPLEVSGKIYNSYVISSNGDNTNLLSQLDTLWISKVEKTNEHYNEVALLCTQANICLLPFYIKNAFRYKNINNTKSAEQRCFIHLDQKEWSTIQKPNNWEQYVQYDSSKQILTT